MSTTTKAQDLDVVELAEDLPQFGLKRGSRGAVVTVFDHPEEAYDLEFIDASGQSTFAYSVKPNQIRTQSEVARHVFEEGIDLFNQGQQPEAELRFSEAICLDPAFVRVLHNSIVNSLGDHADPRQMITAMVLVLRLEPSYQYARDNLAIAFERYAIDKAQRREYEDAIELLHQALSVVPSDSILNDVRGNFAAVFTQVAVAEYQAGRSMNAIHLMRQAYALHPNETTRSNVGMAFALYAQEQLESGEVEFAIQSLERAELAGILTAQTLNDYGIALMKAGRIDEAINAFRRALVQAPESDAIQHNIKLTGQQITTGFKAERITESFQTDFVEHERRARIDLTLPTQGVSYAVNFGIRPHA